MNLRAVESRHRAAVEVGKKLQHRSLDAGDHRALFASCSDIPELLDHIEKLRALVADEIETYAVMCLGTAEAVSDQMTQCANEHNLATVQTYLSAANIARVGQTYRNPNCTKCRDTRGGPKGHETKDCDWVFPEEIFEEREQCYGRDLIQVGWMGPYGIIPGGMDNEPNPKWRPIYMKKVP